MELKNQEALGQQTTDEIIYRRSWPVRLAKAVLHSSYKIMPRRFYDFLYAFGRRILWFQQRWFYKVRFLAAKFYCKGEGLERSRLVDLLLPFTMGGPLALESAFDIVAKAEKEKVPGALVECGVAKGGCCAMMALACRYYGGKRKLWLFDSYEGLPDPTADDFKDGKTGEMVGPLSKGMLRTTLEQVRSLMLNTCQLSLDDVVFVKGWFQTTLPQAKNNIGKIAVLRLDGDWYESTKCCLEHLYDFVSMGGYIIIDDYATCYGSQRAVDGFLAKRRVCVALVPDGRGGAWFQKPNKTI